MNIGASSPNAVGVSCGAAPPGCSTVATASGCAAGWPGLEVRMLSHAAPPSPLRRRRVGSTSSAGQPRDQFLRRLGGDHLDLRRARPRTASRMPASASATLAAISARPRPEPWPRFRWRLLAWLPGSARRFARGSRPSAPDSRPRSLRPLRARWAAARSLGDLLLRAASTVDWIFGTMPRPMPKKMMPNTSSSQNSCEKKMSGSCSI